MLQFNLKILPNKKQNKQQKTKTTKTKTEEEM